MFTHVINYLVTAGTRSISKLVTNTWGGQASLSESVADASTNLLVAYALDVSMCKSFYMVADQAVVVKTNSSSSPDDTINLIAGIPYVWNKDDYRAFIFTKDITALYITNASGSSATLDIEALYDPSA